MGFIHYVIGKQSQKAWYGNIVSSLLSSNSHN